MRKTTALFLVLLMGALIRLSANDAFVDVSGGSAAPMNEGNTSIRMVAERIDIILQNDDCVVDVRFVFENLSDEPTTVTMGFPEFSFGTMTTGTIKNLGTWVDDVPVVPVVVPDRAESYVDVLRWSTKEVEFSPHQVRTTRVRYAAGYGTAGSQQTAYYLYGTGGMWMHSIGIIEIFIHDRSGIWIDEVSAGLDMPLQIERVDDRTIRCVLRDVEPQPDALITVNLVPEERWDIAYGGFYESPERAYGILLNRLDRSYLEVYPTRSQLRVLRNLVFAWHGYRFGSPDLAALFGRQSWYPPATVFDADSLSERERALVEMILEIENTR